MRRLSRRRIARMVQPRRPPPPPIGGRGSAIASVGALIVEGDTADDVSARVVLELAAVCGCEFDLGTVVHAAAHAPPLVGRARVLAVIAGAEADGTVVPAVRSTTRYRFAPAAAADDLLDGLTSRDRMDRHLRVAIALERSGGDRITIAAHRLRAAPLDPVGAVTAGRRGASDALRRGVRDEAIRLYEMTLDAQLLDEVVDLVARADLLVSLGEAQVSAGRRDDALATFTAAVALDIDQPHRAAIATRAITSYSEWPSQPERDTPDPGVRTLAEAALAALGEDDSPERATALARLGQTMRWAIELDHGLQLIDQAEAMAIRLDDATSRAAVLVARRLVTVAPEAGPARAALTDGAVTLARGASRRDLPLALFLRAADLLECGNLGAATTVVAQLVDEAQRTGEPGHWWFARRFEASLALLAGRLDRAEALADDALHFGLRAQHPRARVSHELQVLHCRVATGSVADRLPYWHEVAETSPWHRATLAWAAATAGHTEDARSAIGDVLALDVGGQPRRASWLALLATTADVIVEVGPVEAVPELRSLLEPHRDQIVTIFNGLVCLGSLERIAGRLALADGDLDAADRHLRRAVAAHDRLGAVLLAASSRADLAETMRRSGDASADTVLEHALTTCRARGAVALAERLGRSAGNATAGTDDSISPRELDVLRLLAAGLTNKQIARQLVISPATVQRHTINLYRKIGASGRSDAAVYAAKHGLLR